MAKRMTMHPTVVDETLDQLTVEEKETNAKVQAKRAIKAAKQFMEDNDAKAEEFPIQAFPNPIRVAITHWVEVTNLSIEHFGTAVLSAASIALGNKMKLKIREGWTEPTLLYCILLGSSGVGKTPIWNYALSPILELEKELYQDYFEALKEHKEKVKEYIDKGMDSNALIEPRPKKIRVEKIATETLLESMWNNPHGIFLFRDELRSWFNSLNQSGRDDVELFLEFWNNGSKVKDLKKDTYFIERTFLSILGALQPQLMKGMATGTNLSNGLFQRFLCGYPYDQEVQEVLSEKQADKDICQMYNNTITHLYEIKDYLVRPQDKFSKPDFRPMLIPMCEEAYKVWHDYYGELARKIKATEDEMVRSTIRKHDKHAGRLAIILRMLRFADENMNEEPVEPEWIEGNIKVEKEDVENAILLSRYFLYQSLRILDAVKTPAHGLKKNYQIWYAALNHTFQRGEAVEVIEVLKKQIKGFKMSNGTMYRLLNDRQLFRKKNGSNGVYDKLWEI